MAKKIWKKPIISIEVGNCRYCKKKIINNESFVSFYKSGHAHYNCMKEDDELRQKTLNKITQHIDKEIGNYENRVSQN
tara:strand:- start:27 stop:260 length:234 start_codon:yes stop_codon:yes gene_type:complete